MSNVIFAEVFFTVLILSGVVALIRSRRLASSGAIYAVGMIGVYLIAMGAALLALSFALSW